MNWSDAVDILRNSCNWCMLVCERKLISSIGMGGLAVEQVGTPTITAQGPYSGVQIAEGFQ
jgi:hypothetical protein